MFVSSRDEVSDAADLIRRFGAEARSVAAARAGRSRDLGNHIHFCRWRQVERLVAVLADQRVTGTVH